MSAPVVIRSGPRRGLVNDFPMRDFTAQVIVPRDMTPTEAARLAEFVYAMAVPGIAPPEPPLIERCQDEMLGREW